MTPADPPGPSEGVPRADPTPAPVSGRSRSQTWFGENSGSRRFLSRWGLTLFLVFVLILGHAVLLPFVFASLIAYILAPIVGAMSQRKNGTMRMPRGLAIIICYIVFLAAVTGFMFLLVPRLSSDVRRIAGEVSYRRINDEWTPKVAHWLEDHFPSLATDSAPSPDEPPVVGDVPLTPATSLVVTPLPDGRFAIEIAQNGVDIKPTPDGGFHVQPVETRPEQLTLEGKLRVLVKKSIEGLKSKLDEGVRFGQTVLTEFIKGIFGFFFTLMIGAFLLIDLEKVHAFLRTLFPVNFRDDYDQIIRDIDRGLSGVIRGQLVICVINASFTFIGLLVFGVKYQLILAVVAGLMSLVPIFGSILSSVPIVIVALASGAEGIDVVRGIAMTLWIIGIHLVEANVLNPKIIGTAAKIHPVLVIFALFLGEYSYGLVGALLAVPLLAAVQVIFMYFYRKSTKDAQKRIETGPVQPGGGQAGPLATTKT